MDPRTFGQTALQLLAVSNIPGNAIDAALQFRDLATRLAEGELTFSPPEPEAPDDDAKD